MAYQVDRYNGTFLTSVEDGTIDTTTDLRFVGKNYAGYGEVQNENFLHLLESFSNTSPPPRALSGQIWYDSGNKKLRFYDGSQFRVAGGAEVSSVAPAGLTTGDFWWDTAAKQLYAWSGTDFVLVGPESSPDLSASAVIPQTVKDINNISHTIAKLISDGKCMAVVSKDEFTLNTFLNPLNVGSPNDFTIIKKGLTLINSATGITTDDHYYWGTSSNSLNLGGRPAEDYLLKGSQSFAEEISFGDPGYSLGNDNDLRVRIENGEDLFFENRLGNDINFRITEGGVFQRTVMKIRPLSIEPGVTDSIDLGSPTFSWQQIYAGEVFADLVGDVTGNVVSTFVRGNLQANDQTIMVNAATKQIGYTGANIVGILTGDCTGSAGSAATAARLTIYAPSIDFPLDEDGITPLADRTSVPIRDSNGDIKARRLIGIADQADQLLVGSSYRTAVTTPTANTITARDASGDIYANLFQGTATSARYADLAEKYLTDKEYDVGTVVSVGGEKEVTATKLGDRAIGVISANPAFMMNKDLEGGTYIALKGRVPVRLQGPIKKGDRLMAGENGVAVAVPYGQYSETFAVSLEDYELSDITLIEAVIL